MLERFGEPDGLVGYRSPLLSALEIPHVFTTRLGEDRTPLDLGSLCAATAARVARAARADDATLAYVRQVHGSRVVEVDGAPLPVPPPEADALVTGTPARLLLVRVADCLPVLLADRDGSRVAAVHAGWRGLLAGVLPQTVKALAARAPVAALGPCISATHFEVGPEVAEAFEAAGLGEAVLRQGEARPHVDLRRAAALQLESCGIQELETTDRCTWTHADEFFSYRRDVTHGTNPSTGRMAALIAVRARGRRQG